MIYIETGRNIEWIEVFLRDKHKTNLNQYLTKYYDIPAEYCAVEDKVHCDICGSHFGWLQGHLKKKHEMTLEQYLSKFNLKPEFEIQVTKQLATNVKKDRELSELKQKQVEAFELGESEKLVIEYQKTKNSKAFQYLLKEWSQKINTHAHRYSSVIISLSQQEAAQDLYQELLEAFVSAVTSYDVTKRIKFNTYAWRCLRNKTQIVSNGNQTAKRKVTEVSTSSMQFADSDSSSEDVGARFTAQNSLLDNGYTPDDSRAIEIKDVINSLDLQDIQRTIITKLIEDKTQEEIAAELVITKEDVMWYINDIRRKYEQNKLIEELFFTLREVASYGVR